jgi:hypothetical protein
MDPMSLDANRIEQGLKALSTRSRDARPVVMRWAVATVALTDIMRSERDVAVTWPEVGAIAARWLEEFGRSTGQWKSHTEAALRMSNMSIAGAETFGSDPPKAAEQSDERLFGWVRGNASSFVRVTLGALFIGFATLKLFGHGPTVDIFVNALPWLPSRIVAPFLATLEMAIGIGLFSKPQVRFFVSWVSFYVVITALPLLLLRDTCFTHFPYAPTLEGQSLIQAVVLGMATLAVARMSPHGGRLRM